jgi:transcriptional regulator with GAF, ATPase, and Fis domain
LREVAAEAAVRRVISEILRSTRGNKSLAARELDTDFETPHLEMKRFGIRGARLLAVADLP